MISVPRSLIPDRVDAMDPHGSDLIPGEYAAVSEGWTKNISLAPLPSREQVQEFLSSSSTLCARQTPKGFLFKEEGYIRHVCYNPVSEGNDVGLFKCVYLSSMKAGLYTVYAAVRKQTGEIKGAYHHCAAGLSRTCQHVVGLLLFLQDIGGQGVSCTDVICSWNVPPAAKRQDPPQPLEDITFRKRTLSNPSPRQKKKRTFSPCKAADPADTTDLVRVLKKAFPECMWLRYTAPDATTSESLLPVAQQPEIDSR